MATTATTIANGANKMRFLIEYSGAGGLSADISTEVVIGASLQNNPIQGALKKLSRAFADGYGAFAAGVLTQAQARALWLSDWSGANPAPGTPAGAFPLIPTAIAKLVPRASAAALNWAVDAGVDGGGHPVLTVTMTSAPGTAGSCYLDVEIPEAIG